MTKIPKIHFMLYFECKDHKEFLQQYFIFFIIIIVALLLHVFSKIKKR